MEKINRLRFWKPFNTIIAFTLALLVSTALKSQCIADFVSTKNTSGSYTFTDASSGLGINTVYNWSFGDGSTSTGISPTHVYAANGTYTVVLSISTTDSATGSNCFNIDTQSVNVNISPVPCALSANYYWVYLPGGMVSFASLSTGTTPFTTYFWSFGDGTSYNGILPSHIYANNGIYQVLLVASTVDPSSGLVCTDSVVYAINVTNVSGQNCDADFVYSKNPSGAYTFTSTSTNLSALTLYNWSFGDGAFGSGLVASHVYAANGTYNVKLTITNIDSATGFVCNDSLIQAVNVNIAPTPCNVSANFYWVYLPSGMASFASTSPGATPYTTYFWRYGDGNTFNGLGAFNIYANNGVYPVTLITTTIDPTTNIPCIDSITYNVNITNVQGQNCDADFVYSKNPSGSYTFTSTSTNLSNITTYNWSFGDGSAGTGFSPTHVYAANGAYSVKLTITNFDSATSFTCSDTMIQSINVNVSTVPCTLSADFYWVYLPGGMASFASTSNGATPYTSNFWRYGDGTVYSGISPFHIYPYNGSFQVTLIASTVDPSTGLVCMDSITKTINITNAIFPYASASFTATPGFTGKYTFNSNSSGVTPATLYNWNFGDGTTGSGDSLVHTYAANGTYFVSLIVKNIDPFTGAINVDSAFKTIIVNNALPCNLNPTINYTINPNGNVSFTCSSILTVAFNTNWNFGDTTTGVGNSISKTYLYNGTYVVHATVQLLGSTCMDTVSTVVNITTAPIPCIANAVFSMIKDTTTALVWNAFPVYSATTVSALWYWGDGDSTFGFNPSHTYLSPGNYNVCLVVTEACGDKDTTCQTSNIFKSSNGASGLMYTMNVVSSFVALGVATDKVSNVTWTVFPNPSTGIINLNGIEKNTKLQVSDLLGRNVLSKTLSDETSIDLSQLNNGTYYLSFVMNGKVFRDKIMIQK